LYRKLKFLNNSIEYITPLGNTDPMKTLAAYYDYAGSEHFAAQITEIRKLGPATGAIILDRTIFYPEGGGQPADRGMINGFPLLDVREQDGEILHLMDLNASAALVTGPAYLSLDTVRRRDFTVQHSAQHLLSGTILGLTGKYTLSMHLGDDICTIDVDAQDLPMETLFTVEEAVQDAIEEDAPLITHLCPPEHVEDFPLRKTPPQGEDVIRVVEIRGHDFSPCCGTHVKSTGAIGMLRILGAEKYKGMTRVTFIAGRRVLRDSRRLRQSGDSISRLLKVPIAEIGAGAAALAEKAAKLDKQVKEYAEAAAQIKAEALVREAKLRPGTGRIYASLCPGSDMEEILRIGKIAQKLTEAVLILGSEGEAKFAAFCSVKALDIRPLIQGPLEAAKGRGGGGPSFFQGVFNSAPELTAFLQAPEFHRPPEQS
jgi:alanyl-tRNA synthetase